MNIGILGGGLTGLTLAANLKHHNFEVLEKENECGGLCRSFQEDGFTFDYGGAHIIFSRNRAPVDYMLGVLGENCIQGRRNNKIYFKGRYVKYPFENGLADLPKEENFECLYHYLMNNYPPPVNFKEWLYFTFGKGIAEKYLVPYNEKIWNYRTDLMSLHWMVGRVPKPPMEDVIKSAIGIETEGYQHQLYFYYPREGGIQALTKGLERKIPAGLISTDFRVMRLKKEKAGWTVYGAAGGKFFDLVVSTIPVFSLAEALGELPAEVAGALAGLRYNSLITVMIGLDTDALPDYTALYYPDHDFKPNRVSFPKVFSPHNVPPGKSSLVAEITANRGDATWEMTDEALLNHVASGLARMGVISLKDICFSKVRFSPYAYVVYDLDYLRNVALVRDYFDELGLILCGRFAEFEYFNMDACVERALALAHKLNQVK
jgi:protoporphyrinogen oxidase